MRQILGDTFDMQIWLIETWTGAPTNVAPEEHDAIAWFEGHELGGLCLAHDCYPAMIAETLALPPSNVRPVRP